MSEGVGVLVLCTGNSCRSQIAAALLEREGGDRLRVWSAGTEPADIVHPLTVQVLSEVGIDLGDKEPQDYRSLLGKVTPYYLITVCDGAARACPSVWPGVQERLSWPFEDPATFVGSEDERLEKFRQVRDEIDRKVRSWVAGEGVAVAR